MTRGSAHGFCCGAGEQFVQAASQVIDADALEALLPHVEVYARAVAAEREQERAPWVMPNVVEADEDELVLDESCGEEMRATYDREEGSIWISCTRDAGHDGPHEDEHYGTKWELSPA